MPTESAPFEAFRPLDTPSAQAAVLSAAFASGDGVRFARALHAVARAKGMSHVAEEAGMTRQGLHGAPGETDEPELSVLMEVTRDLGFRLVVRPVEAG